MADDYMITASGTDIPGSTTGYCCGMTAEGWYVDPFGAHGERWFSAGTPTGLVRDDGRESTDPPPSQEYDGPLDEVATVPAANGEDLLRADGLFHPYDQNQAVDAALDAGRRRRVHG